MDTIQRVQAYMPAVRQEGRTVQSVGPFTVAFHPTDEGIESNLAISHTQAIETPEDWLEDLRATFAMHGRTPAIQWIDEYAPRLAAMLRAGGFAEHLRLALLVCTPEMPRAPAPVPELTFVTLTQAAPLADVRESLDVNELGFDPTTTNRTTDEQAEQFRATLGAARPLPPGSMAKRPERACSPRRRPASPSCWGLLPWSASEVEASRQR